MSPTIVLLDIVGGVCLLLWGLRGVRNGITRAFGADLRRVISAGTNNRLLAFSSGIAVTALVQSSTATALIIAAFCGRGFMEVSSGLAVMLGADVGTTLVAQLLSLNLKWLAPFLLVVGYILFSKYDKAGKLGHIGKMVLHLGLMLLALALIREAAAPLKESEVLPVILNSLQNDPFTAMLIVAVLTWIAHSSLAVVLLLVSFVMSGVLPESVGLAMVLGANLGGAVGPLVASMREGPMAARVPLGNLIIRAIGVTIMLPLMPYVYEGMKHFGDDPSRMIVNFHMLFNIMLAVLFLPFIKPLARVTEKLMPEKDDPDDMTRPKYLDDQSLETPVIALAAASRETLRMADILEGMMEKAIRALEENDLNLVHEIKEEDDTIDRLNKAIKHYMARITQESLDPEEVHRYMQILIFSMNLEHAGDILDKGLMAIAEKKVRGQRQFSKAGLAEIKNIHKHVINSVRMAQTVFMSEDVSLARQMIREKDKLRLIEQEATASHFRRFHNAVPETVSTTSMHMDVIRDYRRINTHLAAIAYTILEESGQLRKSRLKTEKAAKDKATKEKKA